MRKTPHGIPLISERIHRKVFKGIEDEVGNIYVKRSADHLRNRDLYPESEDWREIIDFEVPELVGEDLKSHFERCAEGVFGGYIAKAEEMAYVKIPPPPSKWVFQVGWTRYEEGKPPESVRYPLEDCMVFDVEVTVKYSNYPTIACAATPVAWYMWVSPHLTGGDSVFCPLGGGEKLVIAHNASYDRARVKEEYEGNTDIRYLDTFSLHMAVGGISSKQRPLYLKHLKAKESGVEMDYTPQWLDTGAMNSLADLVQLYKGEKLDKDIRDVFVRGTLAEVRHRFQELAFYNANDVLKTWQVYQILFPKFKRKCPSKVTMAGMLTMSKAILHTRLEKWINFKGKCEMEFQRQKLEVEKGLRGLIEETIERWEKGEDFTQDPWLKNLDWTVKPKVKTLKGKPNWYRDLWDSKLKDIKITTRTVVTPYILRLAWNGYPLKRIFEYGWGYVVPVEGYEGEIGFEGYYLDEKGEPVKTEVQVSKGKKRVGAWDREIIETEVVPASTKNSPLPPEWAVSIFFRIPHKDGDGANCGNPLAKDYLKSMESGVLASENILAKQVLESAISCSYWVSIRERVENQFVVGLRDGSAVIIPQLLVSGTVTRRAVENLWLTASSAKKNRIGSEIKAMVTAPIGYKYVGADVTAEEAWLFALLGDAYYGFHGSTAIGVQVLTGTKENGTDIHSMTAKILGCNRDSAKQINYARYYGSGLAATASYIKQSNKELTDIAARDLAKRVFKFTKGERNKEGRWEGGTESHSFNEMEKIAKSSDPRTPVLRCGISDALHPSVVKEDYITSRTNWVIQSSGVDFLHLALTAIEWLCREYEIEARLMLTIHDEIRYIVADRDVNRFALALQVAHLWTRAAFAEAMDIYDLPECVAWFDEIDIDHVLRKDPKSPCLTPSQTEPIPPGEVITIKEVLARTGGSLK